MKPFDVKVAEKYRWEITQDGAALLRPCFSLHFNWTPLYKHT
jgi:hypothetical protein